MKSAIFGLMILVLMTPGLLASSSSFGFEAGAFYGARQVADSEIKNVYGNGLVYFPYAALKWKGIILGGGYEGGYAKTAEIGIYKESSRLKVEGFEVFIGYEFKIRMLAPYFRVGYGSYTFKQTIDSPFLGNFKVDGKKATATGAAGIRIYPFKNLFLAGEVRYVPLKVKPYEDEVDLSGWRFSGGFGFSL